MNKADLISDIANKTSHPKTTVAEIVDAAFDAMSDALTQQSEVRIPNFGVFIVVNAKARKARNPQTGEEVKVPAGPRVRFRTGKALKDRVEMAPPIAKNR